MPAPLTNATVTAATTDKKPKWLEEEKPGTPAFELLPPPLLPLPRDPELEPEPELDAEPAVPLGADVTVPVPTAPAWLIRVAQLPVGLVGEAVVADPLKSQAEAPFP